MKIGFASIYPYRPHVKHLAFLAQEAERFGHEVFWLECDRAFDICSAKLNKGKIGKAVSCLKCTIGGLRGFLNTKPDLLSKLVDLNQKLCNEPQYSAISTVASAIGLSDVEQLNDQEFQNTASKIQETVDLAKNGAAIWLKDRELDAVFCFNGRLDITNAIMIAAIENQVPFISVERSWLGVGIQLTFNGTPLSLNGFNDALKLWRDKPLTSEQICKSFISISNRYKKKATGEFRQYNEKQKFGLFESDIDFEWLYLPSSIFERIGHPDWDVYWQDDIDAVERLISNGIVEPSKLIIRGHPQWSIFSPDSELRYSVWADKIGARYISSDSEISTQELIWASLRVIVYGSSAAFEAGLLGKQIINLSPTFYSEGDFLLNILNERDIQNYMRKKINVAPREIVRMCMRALYIINYRYMQCTNSIRADNPFDYSFSPLTDDKYFDKIIIEKCIPADDIDYADNSNDEDRFLDNYMINVFDNICSPSFSASIEHQIRQIDFGQNLKRKSWYRIIDFYDRDHK